MIYGVMMSLCSNFLGGVFQEHGNPEEVDERTNRSSTVARVLVLCMFTASVVHYLLYLLILYERPDCDTYSRENLFDSVRTE